MIRELSSHQCALRRRLLKLYFEAKCGHIACSLSCLDIVHACFSFKTDQEVFILSKGHAAGAMYVVLNQLGRLSDNQLATFYQDGTKLAAHPSVGTSPDIPFALGSLGHGLPIATGVAFGKKHAALTERTFVLMSDGETNEGTTWEAAHFAVRHKLNRLVVFIDKNGLQGFGQTHDVLGDTAKSEVWREIGFNVIECDVHDEMELLSIVRDGNGFHESKPTVVIAQTVKGRGVPFMEGKLEWHYLPLDQQRYDEAIASLTGGHNEG